jgi:hypothetical protein
MPALPTGLITQLTGDTHHPKLARAYLAAVDLVAGETPPWLEKEVEDPFTTANDPGIAFQYWPESLNDSRGSEWNPRSIPGGSHPIYQWTQGGERRLSFTAIFTRDHEPPPREEAGGLAGIASTVTGALESAAQAVGLGGPVVDKIRNVPIESAVRWLRYFTYPYYDDDDLRVFEPPKVLLVLPGSKLNINGDDEITCVMTTCDITYEAWFPGGAPRIVEVSLEFAEVVQGMGKVAFHNRKNFLKDDFESEAGRENSLASVLGVKGGAEGGLIESIAGAITGGLGF